MPFPVDLFVVCVSKILENNRTFLLNYTDLHRGADPCVIRILCDKQLLSFCLFLGYCEDFYFQINSDVSRNCCPKAKSSPHLSVIVRQLPFIVESPSICSSVSWFP